MAATGASFANFPQNEFFRVKELRTLLGKAIHIPWMALILCTYILYV